MNTIFNKVLEGFTFSNDLKKDSYDFLVKHNRFRIAEHTLKVAQKARVLAKQYGEDENLAEVAALLHDISGIYPNEQRIDIANSLRIEILHEEEKLPLILHQKISRVMAEEVFNITNPKVLSAIECHTTLKAKPSNMDMIIFVADKIEWDQDGEPPYLKELEEAVEKSLELAAFTYIKYKFDNRESMKVVHPWMEEAYRQLSKFYLQKTKII